MMKKNLIVLRGGEDDKGRGYYMLVMPLEQNLFWISDRKKLWKIKIILIRRCRILCLT